MKHSKQRMYKGVKESLVKIHGLLFESKGKTSYGNYLLIRTELRPLNAEQLRSLASNYVIRYSRIFSKDLKEKLPEDCYRVICELVATRGYQLPPLP